MAGASALAEAPPISIVVEAGRVAAEQFAPTIKASAADAVKAQVADYLDKCSKQTTLRPSGCPFAAYDSGSYGAPTNVFWSITATPTHVIGISGSDLTVTTSGSGTAGVTWQGTDYRNQPTLQTDSAWQSPDGTSVQQDFRAERTMQSIPVSATTSTVRLKVLQTLAPAATADPRIFAPISEVRLSGAS